MEDALLPLLTPTTRQKFGSALAFRRGMHSHCPQVEERSPHAYEGEGLGRRESLRGEELPPAHHESEHAKPQHT
jgi:hypothetical protein